MSKKNRFSIITTLIMISAFILPLSGCSLFSTKVNLNDYITISAEGYDSYGKATFDFDWEAYEEDYSKKIKSKDKSNEEAFEEAFAECVKSISLDKSSGLVNGDEIILKCDIDGEKAKKDYNVVFEYTEMKYTVSDLKEPKDFDPFEDVYVFFDGMSRDARARIEFNTIDEKSPYLYYEVSPKEGLANGDTVTVTVSISDIERFVQTFGEYPSATSKDYKVEGLKAFIQSASELTEENLNKIHNQADDAIKSRLKSHDMWYGYDSVVENVEYVGNYFLVPKEGSNKTGNILYMIYHVDYSLTWKDEPTDEKYVVMKYTDIMDVPEEGVFVNAMDYSLHYAEERKTGFGLETYGYDNFDQIYDKFIINAIEYYTYEKNFTE